MSQFPALRLEGGLLGPDILEQLLAGELPGQKPRDFGLDDKRSLTEEMASVFADARTQWEVFRRRLARLPEGDPATSVTRDAWVIPFLSLLGYELRYNQRAYEIDGATFAISHRAGEAEDAPPVHIVGVRQELGRLAPTGRPRLAPHSLLQEYLNRSEHLWGIVTNGLILPLLRDSTFVRRQAYVEFDLQQILEEQRFNDFAILFRLLHRSHLPQRAEQARECWLEKYYQQALEQGGRVRERLRDGVEECLKGLANGFLAHPKNSQLRERLASSGLNRLTPEEFYRQLLRLVYRFLFLLVSEERGLISASPLYRDHYGVGRLRRLLERRSAFTEHEDLWCSLRVLWRVLSQEELAKHLGAAPLNGELFAPLKLDECSLSNRDLLQAFWHLAYYRENATSPPRRVNYAALDVEELGSVYESLLDYRPQILFTAQATPQFELSYGSERKSTGSYYTPPDLVAELVRSALEPVLQERLKSAASREEKERAILSLRVLDPACGSGHFLLAAARRLGKELAKVRTGEEEPAPETVREAIRDVVAHCIYGVDKNPLAVELCRVALWLEAHCAGKPLTFLDHRIKCGDSLVGMLDLKVLDKGLPDAAFEAVSAHSREAARSLKRRNRAERRDLETGQLSLSLEADQVVAQLSQELQQLEAIQDDSPANVRRKQELYTRYCQNPEHQKLTEACNLWTAAFFQHLTSDFSAAITTKAVSERLQNRANSRALATAVALACEQYFFHWPLEFPEVFHLTPSPNALGEGGQGGEGGFDIILGNPPWERIKLQEEEFFAVRDPQIARAANAAARKRLIAALPQTNPALWEAYQRALHAAESASRFLRGSGQYPLTGRGDINTYSVFAERVRSLLNSKGQAGLIVPTGIATDATNQFFFADLVEKGQLVSLFDFENREALFPGVHRSYKFCLLTLTGGRTPTDATTFTFFATHADHLRDPRRVFTLTADDIARINPNTRTLPVFRTRQDADLTRAIYQRVPVLVNEHTGENSWGVRFLRMFDMSNDSHLFRTRAELEKQGYRLVGNVFVPSPPSPLSHAAGEGGRIAAPDLSSRAAGEGGYELPKASQELIARARQLRREATTAESLLWELLRDRRLLGRKFRRQHPIGQFIADFFCDDARLIIEIDGAVHREPTQQERDRLREEILREHGFAILRFTNDQILDRTEQVLQEIAAYVTAHSYEHPSPLSQSLGRGAGGEGYLPLYEAKMIWHYDHRYGTYEGVRDRSSTQLPTPDEHQHADPHFVVQPWYWVRAEEVAARLGEWQRGWLLGFRNVARSTDERTAIFSLLPRVGAGHKAPLIFSESQSAVLVTAWLANFSSLVLDFVTRQKIGGTSLGFFILRQLPVLPPDAYTPEDLRFIVPRVLELVYTSWDMKPFADDVWREADEGLRAVIRPHPPTPSPAALGEGFPFPPFTWNEERRAILRAELDAYYARLYGLTRKQLRYILDPADLTERELEDILDPREEVADPLDPAGYATRAAASTFPGETFRVLKEKEIRQYGEYRTRRLVLEAWEKLAQH
ncbi:very-short-patch-repair endonuclease/type I restriction-modification system DNA methylase subunit [Thermostichus sp. MS-CIW-19]